MQSVVPSVQGSVMNRTSEGGTAPTTRYDRADGSKAALSQRFVVSGETGTSLQHKVILTSLQPQPRSNPSAVKNTDMRSTISDVKTADIFRASSDVQTTDGYSTQNLPAGRNDDKHCIIPDVKITTKHGMTSQLSDMRNANKQGMTSQISDVKNANTHDTTTAKLETKKTNHGTYSFIIPDTKADVKNGENYGRIPDAKNAEKYGRKSADVKNTDTYGRTPDVKNTGLASADGKTTGKKHTTTTPALPKPLDNRNGTKALYLGPGSLIPQPPVFSPAAQVTVTSAGPQLTPTPPSPSPSPMDNSVSDTGNDDNNNNEVMMEASSSSSTMESVTTTTTTTTVVAKDGSGGGGGGDGGCGKGGGPVRNLRARGQRKFLLEKTRHKRQTLQDMTRPLKQWLLHNKDNPYPSKDQKMELVYKSQMTLTQVSNWFANARRRLKNTVKQPDLTWASRIKLYNSCVEGNAELFSLCSDDSCDDSDDDMMEHRQSDTFHDDVTDSMTSSRTATPEVTGGGGETCNSFNHSSNGANHSNTNHHHHNHHHSSHHSQNNSSGSSAHSGGSTAPHPHPHPHQGFDESIISFPKYKHSILHRYLIDSHQQALILDDDPVAKSRDRHHSSSTGSRDFEELSTSSVSSPAHESVHHDHLDDFSEEFETMALRRRTSDISSTTAGEDDMYWKEIGAALALTSLAKGRAVHI